MYKNNHDAPADRFLLPLEDSISRTTIKDADPRSQRCAAVRCGGLALLFTLFGANKRSAAAGCEILLSNLEDDVLNCLCQPHDPDQPYVATASLLTVSDDRVRWTNDVQTLLYCTCRADSMH